MLSITVCLLAAATLGGDDDFKREQDLSRLEGKTAPALQVQGWTNSGALDLVGLRGKVVVLDFWGTW